MTESAAEIKYRAFESLRKCFGAEQRAESERDCNKFQPQQQSFRRESSGKRRPHDPRANAPPLVPLVEEGDQLDEVSNYRLHACKSCSWKGGGAGLLGNNFFYQFA